MLSYDDGLILYSDTGVKYENVDVEAVANAATGTVILRAFWRQSLKGEPRTGYYLKELCRLF